MTESPYKGVVVDLVDPYFTPDVKNTGGFKAVSAGGSYAIWWLRQNPGRWALVSEGNAGLTRSLLKFCPDILVSEKKISRFTEDGKFRTYACVPHPEGEPLSEALARRPIAPSLYLPKVTTDEFGWTQAELDDACQVARDNLFPTGA